MIDYFLKAFIFALQHFAAIGVFALLCGLVGRRMTQQLAYHSRLEQWCFSIALGLGVMAYLVFFLGLSGFLHKWLLLSLLLAGLLICRPFRPGWGRRLSVGWEPLMRRLRHHPALSSALIVTALLILAPFLLLSLYPPVEYDGTMYHLPYAKIYIQNHGLVFTPYLRFPVAPQINEMLFTLALLLYDDILSQLVELLMLATLVLATISFAQRFFSALSGWWAGAILLSNPIVIWLGTIAYVDVGATLFMFMSIYAFTLWVEEEKRGWLILAGVFCGLGVGAKLYALIVPAVLGLILAGRGFKERKLTSLFLFSAVSLIVAAPWLMRSLYYTGNPIYPFLHNQFRWLLGGWHWRPINHDGLFAADHWEQKTVLNFLLLPWRLTFEKPFPSAPSAISHVYFFTLPLMLAAAVKYRRQRWLLGGALVYLIFWFCTLTDMRYLLLLLVLASVGAADAVEKAICRCFPNPVARAGKTTLAAAGFILFLLPGWVFAVRNLPGSIPPDLVPISQASREAFLTKYHPSFPAFKYLNELRGSNYTVYSLFNEQMTYFADGRFIGGLFAPGGRASLFVGDPKNGLLVNGEELYRFLDSIDADYFLVESDKIELHLPTDHFFQRHFKLVYQQPKLRLFERYL